MKFGGNVHGPQRMNPKKSCDRMCFWLAPPSGQIYYLVHDEIPAKLMDFPIASAVLGAN